MQDWQQCIADFRDWPKIMGMQSVKKKKWSEKDDVRKKNTQINIVHF